jgi:3-oxoacyl-[acyl-carrier protein] reductase
MLGIFEHRHAQATRGWKEVLTRTEKASLIDHTLLKRTGRIDDVVKACLFIISDAPYMTGSVLKLDGGYTLAGEDVPPMPKGIV